MTLDTKHFNEQGYSEACIDKEVSAMKQTNATSNVTTGRKSAIGATALQLTATSTKCTGVYVKASAANTGTVYVGKSTVTANSADATDGFELSASEGVFITVNDPSFVYAIASAAGQSLFFMVTY
jgi:hypothetical protein